ncbi:succinylglutamate desuccinylase/aspartoacylase domain-containing protein [Limnobacter parvus]|uniref:Succinylglutamate desuccinylase/aspartoacylase family protein n=1 Tax=Limnobacter parvus TaxID=2939690 RepID=A0ABT1XK78_9BURK|nr:succinylglutamate desuccinylase/aspartoacylase family protein [Limnobacter parvus]MCR2747701.1 succinylglutamate desuccinylase/aspartoacylase family protein [Limnobacter parvus]
MLPAMPHALQFKSVTFTALKPGPKLIVLGAVHGNEVSGSKAILKMIAEFESGTRLLQKGQVTFVPITNPLAYNRKQRNGDRNLNRNLTATNNPVDFEDHVANWLCPLLAAHDVLLDIHSFQKGDVPFALFGPKNNNSELEKFEHEDAERGLALRLGVTRFVDGWLDTYAKGVANRVALLKSTGQSGEGLNTDPRYGMGTTECMRSSGGYAVTLECGQHDDANGPVVAYQAIDNTLVHLGLLEGMPIPAVENYQHLSLVEVIDKVHVEDQFAKAWSSFDSVHKGELIGVRKTGDEVRASQDGFIVFPNTLSQAGQEWFYIAVSN